MAADSLLLDNMNSHLSQIAIVLDGISEKLFCLNETMAVCAHNVACLDRSGDDLLFLSDSDPDEYGHVDASEGWC